jgi:hypothetical protein
MCDPVTAMAATSMVGGMYQAKGQAKQAASDLSTAYVNAANQRWQGEQIRKQADTEAGDIIDQGRRVVATQEAQQAASGVDVNSGSALVGQDDTDKRARADALATIYSGINGQVSANTNARYTEQAGRSRSNADVSAAYASVLQGVTSAASSVSNYRMLSAKRD